MPGQLAPVVLFKALSKLLQLLVSLMPLVPLHFQELLDDSIIVTWLILFSLQCQEHLDNSVIVTRWLILFSLQCQEHLDYSVIAASVIATCVALSILLSQLL